MQRFSFTVYTSNALLIWIISAGCSDQQLAPDPFTVAEATGVVGYVLPSTDGITVQSFPYQMMSLLQHAPSDAEEESYWQWYRQTLMASPASTEYYRLNSQRISLLWYFDTDKSTPCTGRVSLRLSYHQSELIVVLQAQNFASENLLRTGTHRSVWRKRGAEFHLLQEEYW